MRVRCSALSDHCWPIKVRIAQLPHAHTFAVMLDGSHTALPHTTLAWHGMVPCGFIRAQVYFRLNTIKFLISRRVVTVKTHHSCHAKVVKALYVQ